MAQCTVGLLQVYYKYTRVRLSYKHKIEKILCEIDKNKFILMQK